MEEFDIRDPNNKIILQVYQGDNYQCIETGIESDLCYIFFSSHGLYYPDTRDVFEEQMLKKNRYEWKSVVSHSPLVRYAGKIIYVRDVYKIFYSWGINSRINTIDKVLDLLRELTDGWRVVTVGSSAGGYMAVLSAVKLNAEFCLNNSGQYLIPKELNNPYYNLAEIMPEYKGCIFYFLPSKCELDRRQYQCVEGIECVKEILFNDTKHAATMLAGNWSYIICLEKKKLLALYEKNKGKEINKLAFLMKTAPFSAIFGILRKELKGFAIRRIIGKHWNGD